MVDKEKYRLAYEFQYWNIKPKIWREFKHRIRVQKIKRFKEKILVQTKEAR